jgi:hypothetical protein
MSRKSSSAVGTNNLRFFCRKRFEKMSLTREGEGEREKEKEKEREREREISLQQTRSFRSMEIRTLNNFQREKAAQTRAFITTT